MFTALMKAVRRALVCRLIHRVAFAYACDGAVNGAAFWASAARSLT